MRRVGAAALLAALVALAAAACGPAQCYNGCTDARPLVDFLLLVDDSGSMSSVKTAVVNGLTAWAEGLNKQNINAAYSIVTFGTPPSSQTSTSQLPKVVQSMTTDFAQFKTKLSNGITLNGYWEAGIEAIRCIAGTANKNNINNNIGWRAGAKRVLILLTDEDSDPAMWNANRIQSKTTLNGWCKSSMSSGDWATFQQEIDLGVAAIKAAQFSYVYMLVWPSIGWTDTCNTFAQYGNPSSSIQSQNSDFSNFNIAQTLANINNNAETKNSLQGQLLRSTPQIPARVFDVQKANNANFIKNFFAAITADVSQCDPCFRYDCSGNKCMDPVNICDCKGVPNGNAVVDCAGVCGGTATRDCAGVCNGNNKYDACGICTANGATSSLCQTDCANNKFISSKPSVAFLKTCASAPTWFQSADAQAGYIVANSDLKAAGTSGKWTAENICEHFRAHGQFENRQTCEFDKEAYAVAAGTTVANAASHYVSTGLRSGISASCKAGTTAPLPPRSKDSCNQCVANPLSPPFCKQDCTGAWRTSEASMVVVDDCGVCGGDNAAKDDCGVCNGGNRLKDPCGVCNGVFGQDGCGGNLCNASRPVCLKDCNDQPFNQGQNPANQQDECGVCVPFGTRSANCKQDCGGVWYIDGTDTPTFWLDQCDNCMPNGITSDSCTQDCNDRWGGDGKRDPCGQCVSTHPEDPETFECLFDCANTPYLATVPSPHVVDDCDQCVARDDEDAFNALKDGCGVCTNKLGYNSTAECVFDCDEKWYNVNDETRPIVDDCGDCVLYNQRDQFNRRRNACGLCVADPNNETDWYFGQKKDSQGNYCSCNVDPSECADGTTSCVDCPPPMECPGGGSKDECGHCPGDDMYNKKDRCGMCCGNYGNETGVICDIDVDDCGVCFGLNANKTTNVCNLCNPADCIVDCNGVPFGPAVYDCAGICGGKSICAVCGNGIVEGNEACDEGALNGAGSCTTECTIVSGALTGGQIAGAVIGAIAAVALIAALALFGWRYAVSNGLFGSAKNKVDMGASNSNPLYESETKVASNPLYAGN